MKRIALILTLMMPSWAWTQNYLCIGEQTTGFIYQNNKWDETSFSDEKFIVKIENKKPTVTKFGEKGVIFVPSDCVITTNFVSCSSFFGQFKIRTDNLLFLYTYTIGYVENKGEDNTPLIQVGTCSKF